MTPGEPAWWRDGVLYQVYPRSFAGDLRGLTGKLGYLEWLGVDGIWLNPIMPSPNADGGYDVSDYLDVHPDLGSLADLDALVTAASGCGIRVLLASSPTTRATATPGSWTRAAASPASASTYPRSWSRIACSATTRRWRRATLGGCSGTDSAST
jgi:alpha-glucosidase